MMKAVGQSKKGDTSTGSYGIGKFAPFANSDLRTVFVSTVWQDGKGRYHHYVQGKAVLMSHLDDRKQIRRGTGFWGVKAKCQPVTSLSSDVPDWLRLAPTEEELPGARGTMLSIVGFQATKGWQDILAANIMENFFGTIQRGDLEISFDDGPQITAATLPSMLEDTSFENAVADQPGEPERFKNAALYLKTLNESDQEVIVQSTENYHLGECVLRLLIGENLPKRVAVLRNGMLITESLQGLRRFGDFKEFVAILECRSEKGTRLLRAMEPPRHDAFEPDRLPADQRASARVALKELAEWVRKILARYAKDPVVEETPLDELADFFGEEDEKGTGKVRDENPEGTITIRARPLKPRKGGPIGGGVASADDEGDDVEGDTGTADGRGKGEGNGGTGNGRPNNSKDGDAPPSGGATANASRATASGLPLRDVRAILLGPTKRRIAFTPSKSGSVIIQLQESGADTNYALSVASTSLGQVKDGQVSGVFATAGVRCVVEVELAKPFAGTVRVVANAV